MQCVTLSYGKVIGNAKRYPYWQGAIYETRKTKKGILIWQYVSHVGTARRSKQLAMRDIEAFSAQHNIPIITGVRNNVIAYSAIAES